VPNTSSGNIRNLDKVQNYLKSLPRGTIKIALEALGEWFIGTGQRGLKRYPPYKYVTRAQAYGRTFKSAKQRGYVMAQIRAGRIDPGAPHRTGNTQRGWSMSTTGGGYRLSLVNPTAGAYYSMSDTGQARLNALVGWRKVSDILSTNIKGAIRHAISKVNEFLKQKGK